MRAVLQQAGIVVEAVADPNSVEAQIQQFSPDLLLVDLLMPDVDGMTLTMRLRARADLAMLPIVFLSGEQGDRARLQAIHVGGDDYLAKPVRPSSVVATVRDRIQRVRSWRRQLAPAVSELKARRGRARRGEFLAKLAGAAKPVDGLLHVLLALKIDQADNFAAIFSAWRETGRSLVIDTVDDVTAVMRLWSFGIDYLQGDALAAPSPRLDLEAAEIEV